MADYVYRHWRGELSLPVSYWLNGCLLSVTLNALGRVTVESSAWQLQVFGASLALLGIPIIAVWQLIGIYRSANGKLGIWSKLAKGSVVFGWLRLIAYLGQLAVGFDNEANQHATATPRKQPAAATSQSPKPEGLRYVDRDLGNNEVMLSCKVRLHRGIQKSS
jgi:hypothetical protein